MSGRRRTFLLVAGGVVLLFALATAGVLTGFWIPNQPAAARYPIHGIDVSRHQGVIDWSRVPRERVAFSYIKATEGGDFRDVRFEANWQGARRAGVVPGGYHFFTLKTPGLAQARNFIQVVPNERDALPPAVDLEFAGNTDYRPDIDSFQQELDACLDELRRHYQKEPVIYTMRNFQRRYLRGHSHPRLWFRCTIVTPRMVGQRRWDFWQYSDRGRIPGVPTLVDLNVFHGSEAEFAAFVR